MRRLEHLSRMDTEEFRLSPASIMSGLLRCGPRPDRSVPTAEEIITHAGDQILRREAEGALRACRQRIRRVPAELARPYREDDPHFDIRYHFSVYPAREPVPVDAIGDLLVQALDTALDPERPLWRIQIIESFSDGTFGLLSTNHHAVADGTAAMGAIVAMTLGVTPDRPVRDPSLDSWTPDEPHSGYEAVAEAMAGRVASLRTGWRGARRAARRLSIESVAGGVARVATYLHHSPPPPVGTRFRRQPSEGSTRIRAHELEFSLLDLRLTTRALGATINELFLAAIAVAWPVVEPGASCVWVRLPVGRREAGDTSLTNKVGFALTGIPSGLDPLSTLRAAQAESTRVKREDQSSALEDLVRVRSLLPASWQRDHLGRFDDPDVILSNMPGVPIPLYCQGAPLLHGVGTSTLVAGWGKLTICTFADTVNGSLIEASGDEGQGAAFLGAFCDTVGELGRLARTRSLLARQRQLVALAPRDLDQLTLAATTMTVGEGDAVVSEGEAADAFYVVANGLARATAGADRGNEAGAAPPSFYRAGDSFGEVGVFRGGVRRATVVAERPTELLRIDGAALLSLFGKDPLGAAPLQATIDEYLGVG